MNLFLAICSWAALSVAAFAQQNGKQPQPVLLDCGVHGTAEVLCGTRSPEDLEATPDNKFLITGEFVRTGNAALALFDPVKKTFSKIPVSAEPLKDWGDAQCPGPIGDAIAPHGLSLTKRLGGKWQLYVVNHGGRESIEMYELKQSGGAWTLTWHGCVTSMQEYNDVAALADGGFIATHPTALRPPGADLMTGVVSGYVARWSPGKGEIELPGTRTGFPNGVIASPDGRVAYFNAWTRKEVHRYDTRLGKDTGMVTLDFMPDNLTWTKNGRMLAAGVKGARGECPPGSGTPCNVSFGVAEIDPAKMTSRTVFDSEGKGALIAGVSVALEAGDAIYIGAFTGDRLVKIPKR